MSHHLEFDKDIAGNCNTRDVVLSNYR